MWLICNVEVGEFLQGFGDNSSSCLWNQNPNISMNFIGRNNAKIYWLKNGNPDVLIDLVQVEYDDKGKWNYV